MGALGRGAGRVEVVDIGSPPAIVELLPSTPDNPVTAIFHFIDPAFGDSSLKGKIIDDIYTTQDNSFSAAVPYKKGSDDSTYMLIEENN